MQKSWLNAKMKDNKLNVGRVMGYFRPFSHFNKGKKSEFEDRGWFVEENCAECNMQVAV